MKLIKFFKERNPWATIIIAVILGPIIGMLYLNKAILSLSYLAATAIMIILPFIIGQWVVFSQNPIDIAKVAVTVVQITGAAHCFLVARQQKFLVTVPWYARWYVVSSAFVMLLCFVLLFRTFCYEPFMIPSISMSPTLNNEEYIYSKKFAYRNSAPERGDVITFKKDGVYFVKRIAGIPGDKIQIKDSILNLNGTPVSQKQAEDYVVKDVSIHQFIETLPEGRAYKILDESPTAPLDNTEIYTVPEGHYFVLGDNRDNSQDSRVQTIGNIPAESITGEAIIVMRRDSKKRLRFQKIN